MALPKDELIQVLGNIVLGPERHIADAFALVARQGLPERVCACGRRIDPELDGYSRTCAECLGDDDRREASEPEERFDAQTGWAEENGL